MAPQSVPTIVAITAAAMPISSDDWPPAMSLPNSS